MPPNLIEWLGGFKRENPEWSGELGKELGERGTSVRRTPLYDLLPKSLTHDRPFTFGNTIFVPKGASERYTKGYRKKGTLGPTDVFSDEDIIREEIPHVQQFRSEGLIGFLGKHVWDLAKHGGGQKTYDVASTHEGYHSDPKERSRLMGEYFSDEIIKPT
jgi:hypothetical protein|tara:strand:+ start:369 stop:848 length:480 start_codon:yes stop_codon:yes gene_type:complete